MSSNEEEHQNEGEPPALAEVGRYASLAKAEEHGLVVLAMQLPCWLLAPEPASSSSDYLLAVPRDDAARASAEIGLDGTIATI